MRTASRTWVARILAGGLLAGLALLPIGCGGGTGTVTGKVTFDGKPLTSGNVVFTNANGKGSQSVSIQADGSYKVERMPTGPAKVAVVTSPPPGSETGSRMPAPKLPTPPPDKLPPGVDPNSIYGGQQPGRAKFVKIPENYGDPEKSGLTHTVTSGAQEWNIELK